MFPGQVLIPLAIISPPPSPAVQVMSVTKAAPERVVGKLNNAKLFQT